MATADPKGSATGNSSEDGCDEAERSVESAFRSPATTATSQQPHPPHPPIYHPYPPPPPGAYSSGGPYSAAVGSKPRSGVHYPTLPPPQAYQPPNPSTSHLTSSHHEFHRPIPVRAHESDYRGHPPPHSTYYPPTPDDRRWHHQEVPLPPPHLYPGYESQHYNPPVASSQSFPPPPAAPPGHIPYPYPQPVAVYPNSNRHDENPAQINNHDQTRPTDTAAIHAGTRNSEADDREGATSPTQIENSHRDEVQNLGCTCKKTKCLKLYCQCFAVKIYCGANCRCLVCFNTTKHEKHRKEAMRIILSRNPAAFDNKFLKTKERKTKEQQPVLAHKLGCKCRKSACMKKYCECYAGNVKCSQNCRCVGCKNIPSSHYGPDKPNNAGMLLPYDHSIAQGRRAGREPWMMNAAHNLAFLKHGSPVTDKPTTAIHESVPSLAASSSDTSPEERNEDATTKESSTSVRNEESNGTVNSLLLAAMAMTEFQSRNNHDAGTASHRDTQKDQTVSDESADPQQQAKIPSIPRASPKRKSTEIPEATDNEVYQVGSHVDSPGGRQEPASPLDPRELKRTRLGSVFKAMTWAEAEEAAGPGTGERTAPRNNATITEERTAPRNNATTHETPEGKKSAVVKLTPVSARCIDFKRMQVAEKKT